LPALPGDHRNLDVRRGATSPEDPLRRSLEIRILRLEDVRNELLRISIDEREPAALHLHLNPVTLAEAVILGVQVDDVLLHLVRRDGFRMLETFAESAPQY